MTSDPEEGSRDHCMKAHAMADDWLRPLLGGWYTCACLCLRKSTAEDRGRSHAVAGISAKEQVLAEEMLSEAGDEGA